MPLFTIYSVSFIERHVLVAAVAIALCIQFEYIWRIILKLARGAAAVSIFRFVFNTHTFNTHFLFSLCYSRMGEVLGIYNVVCMSCRVYDVVCT